MPTPRCIRYTPDILAEEGYEYVCDWVRDDRPVMLILDQ
jgi:hypothetical protein